MRLAPAACHEEYHVSHQEVGPFTVVHNRYPARYLLEEHEHEVATIYLVLRGSHVEQSSSSAVDCGDGSVIFSPQGERHSDHYGNAGGEAFLIKLPQRVLDRARDGGVRLDAPRHLAASQATALMRRLYEEAERDDDVTPLAFEALVLHLLAVLRRENPEGIVRVPAWLKRARELMNDRYAERLGLADVAAVADVHPVHFAATFHRCYGVTFGTYLRGIRVEHARRALLESDKPIAEVALECGFFDQSHLSRVFRDATGTTPARYRRGSPSSGLRPPSPHSRGARAARRARGE
ncbi:MAG TPA: AraC family transcriptional regulator [Thermoanaerobaculia bacterium]|nr:AraC family transcriptional regulator [Thermoanaerobaculia bacterium]